MPFGPARVRFCPSASLGVSVFGQGRNAHAKFGKTVIMLDRTPRHAAKAVQEAMDGTGDGAEPGCLPPRRPDLNATGELWRQMKLAVLSGPCVKFGKMCRDVKRWPGDCIPRPDMFRYPCRSV